MTDPPRQISDAEARLSDLAHEFTLRLRQGESPSIEEYLQQHPDLADDIREVFETLSLMESPQVSTSLLSSHGYASWHLRENYLEDFRIVRELGRGGMGVVYEAFQESLKRRVALKVLPNAFIADATKAARFRREASVTASLHHPNIVPIFEVGEAEGVQFFAMQFIDGPPLSELLDESHATVSSPFSANDRLDEPRESSNATDACELPAELVLSCMRRKASADSNSESARFRQIAMLGKQVAEALAYAHDAGVIHRDVKPSNLLLDSRGTAWVTDFGLARVAGQDELTSPGDVVGTLRYVPPERFEGHVDARGDIYSLGVTLYEVLTSRPAFTADTRARLMDRILNVSPLAPRRIDPAIPVDLETIILKAMSREPTQRYAHASVMASDLECYLTGRPVSARPLNAWEQLRQWCHRNKALAGVMGLATILLAALLALSIVDSVRIRKQLHLTELAQREAREQLFDALVARAHARWMGGKKTGRRFEALSTVRQAAAIATELKLPNTEVARLRDEAIAALCVPDQEYVRVLNAFPVGSVFLDFDGPMQRFARADSSGTVSIHRVSDHHLIARLPSPGPDFEFANLDGAVFSPDGKCFLQRGTTKEGDTLRVWDVSQANPQLRFELSERIAGVTSFSPNGRYLGVMFRETSNDDNSTLASPAQAHVFDLLSGRDESAVHPANQTWRLVFHPTLPQIVVVDQAGLRIVRWDTGDEIARWDRKDVTPQAWSPDASQLFANAESGSTVFRWDVESRQELTPLVRPNTDWLNGIVFNHRGDRFITRSLFRYQLWEFPSGQLIWDATDGGQPTAHFSADDQVYASCNDAYPHVRLVRHADGLELRRIPLDAPLTDGFPRAVMSHDGKVLAATSKRGTVLFDLDTFVELAVIPGHRIPLVFEPDGSLLTHAGPPEGVSRWPISFDASDRINVAPAISLSEQSDAAISRPTVFHGYAQWDASADGRVIVTPWQSDVRRSGAHAFLQADAGRTTYRAIELGPQYDVHYVSASPDGKYVATGSVSWGVKTGQETDTVTVWDAASGDRIRDLWQGEGFPQFSPDGNWIAVGSSGFPESVRLWRVGSWQQAPKARSVEGPGCAQVAFDANSRLLAVQGTQIRLLIPDSGREVAWLQIAEETSLSPQCITPGGKLIAFGTRNGILYVWDLPAIRRQLAELGLDWDDS